MLIDQRIARRARASNVQHGRLPTLQPGDDFLPCLGFRPAFQIDGQAVFALSPCPTARKGGASTQGAMGDNQGCICHLHITARAYAWVGAATFLHLVNRGQRAIFSPSATRHPATMWNAQGQRHNQGGAVGTGLPAGYDLLHDVARCPLKPRHGITHLKPKQKPTVMSTVGQADLRKASVNGQSSLGSVY